MDKVLHDNIVRLCEEKGLSLRDLQVLMGYDPSVFSWDMYTDNIPFEELTKIAKFFKTDTASLFGIENADNSLVTVEKIIDTFVDKLIDDTNFSRIKWRDISMAGTLYEKIIYEFPYYFYGIGKWAGAKRYIPNYLPCGYFAWYRRVLFLFIYFIDKDTKKRINSKYYFLINRGKYKKNIPFYLDDNKLVQLYNAISYKDKLYANSNKYENDAIFDVVFKYLKDSTPCDHKEDTDFFMDDLKLNYFD